LTKFVPTKGTKTLPPETFSGLKNPQNEFAVGAQRSQTHSRIRGRERKGRERRGGGRNEGKGRTHKLKVWLRL